MRKLIYLPLFLFATSLSAQMQRVMVNVEDCPASQAVAGLNIDGSANCIAVGGGSGVPAGSIVFIITGTCSAGWTEVAALDGKAIYGTLAAHADVGSAVGSATITPTVNSLTAAAQTVNSLTAAAQTFTGTPSTVVVNHVHVQNINSGTTGGSNGYGVDTSTNGSGATAISTANPTGGAASYTPGGTNGASAVTGTMNPSVVTGTLNSFVPQFSGIKVIPCSKD